MPLQRPASGHGLQKASVILGRGRHPAAARLHLHGMPRIAEVSVHAEIPIVGERFRDPPLPRRLRHAEAGLRHPERPQHVLFLILVERLARNHLDDPPDHVDRVAVIPGRAGLVAERQLGQPRHERRQIRVALVETGLHVGLLDRRIAEEPVGQPSRMPHQVLHRHRRCGRHHLHPVDALRVRNAHLHGLEFRQVSRHRVIHPEPARLDERQRRDHRDRLAHRVDAEDVVRLHRVVRRDGLVARLCRRRLRIAAAERMLVAHLAVP